MKLLLFFFLVSLFACKPDILTPSTPPTPPCSQTITESFATVNGFDYQFGSPYYGKPIVQFTIKMETTNSTGNCSSLLSTCKKFVKIKNLTVNTVQFAYNLNYKLNAYNWNYQGAATISPGQSTDYEYMNDNCGSLTLGTIIISSNGISYY